MTTLFSSQWSASPVANWTIQYEYKRSGADMLYRFYWKVWLAKSTSWYYDGLQIQMFLNGMQHNVTVKGYNTSEKGWSYDGTTEWFTISNKTNGTVPFYAKLYDTNSKTIKATSPNYALSVSGAASAIGSISNFDVDNGVTIPITKYDATFADTLVVSYGGTTIKTVPGITNGTKVSFANELATIYNLMRSVKSGTFTFTLTTKSGSTTIGTSTRTANGSITNANPTFASTQVSYADTNTAVTNITGNSKHIVQNKSLLGVTFGAASGNKGATISQYIITVNGVTKTATQSGSVNFGTINSSQNVTLTVTAKDSRGNTTAVQQTVTILAWSLPVFSATVERLNNYEDTTYVTVDASISSVNNKNEMTVTYKVKQSGGKYGNPVEISNKNQHEVICDKNFVHNFTITVVDSFGGSITKEYTLPKGKFPLFIDTDKNAVGINEFPKEGEALRVAGGKAVFEEGVSIGDESLDDFVVWQGISANGWTFRKWNSGVAECWREYAHKPTATGNEGVDIDYPFEFANTPIVTANLGRNGTLATNVVACDSSGNRNNSHERCELFLRGITSADYEIQILIHVIGRWK